MEDRFEQVSDQTGLLRDRDEEVGADDAAGGMVPAGERLEPAELPGLQIVLRLIIWGELAKRNAAAKSAFKLLFSGCSSMLTPSLRSGEMTNANQKHSEFQLEQKG